MSTWNPIGNADTPATVPGVGDDTDEAATRWRSLAVARSVDPAREAAEDRVQRLIDAALELMTDPDGDEVTVQNVVDRAGLSLRAFYHHFPSKDELLLAVFEEAIRRTPSTSSRRSPPPTTRSNAFEYSPPSTTGRADPARHDTPTSASPVEARPVRLPAAVRSPRGGRPRLHPPRVAPAPPPRRRSGSR